MHLYGSLSELLMSYGVGNNFFVNSLYIFCYLIKMNIPCSAAPAPNIHMRITSCQVPQLLPKLDWVDAEPKPAGKLLLKFQGQEVVLSADGLRHVTLGRADENNVTIKGNLISRVHSRIQLNKTRYIIIE